MAQEEFDFESFKNEAIAGLYSGKKKTGTDGVLSPMVKHFLESMMSGELDYHLAQDKLNEQINRKNGKTKKPVRSLSAGSFELETGRDRLGTFEPKIMPKRQLIITDELEGTILSMYAMGVSTRAMRD
ncbi:IS256 family transposase, partial [Elizabethkingia argentiflava]